MSEENKYTLEDIQPIKNIVEHIRMRPGMYIGRVDQLGNLVIISGLFELFEECIAWDQAKFSYYKDDSFSLQFNASMEVDVEKDLYSWFNFNPFSKFYLFQTIVALSDQCTIVTNGRKILCKQGNIVSSESVENSNNTILHFNFDTFILKSSKLPKYLLLNYFKRYVMLYPKKQIDVYEEDIKLVNFKSEGIQEWFATKAFESRLLMKPFQFFVEDEAIDLKAEIIFSMHDEKETFSTITLPRADFVKQNGTHARGFLKGLHRAVKEILGETDAPAFTDYGNLIGVFKLSYPTISFYGPTRNEVGSEELVEIFEKATHEHLLTNNDFRNTILELFGS